MENINKEVEPIDWDSFFRSLVIDCHISPIDIPYIVPAQFIAIITDKKKLEEAKFSMSHADVLNYVRQYQKEKFGREV